METGEPETNRVIIHHVVVKEGEDMIEKVKNFASEKSASVHVLSACGPVSSVVLSEEVLPKGAYEVISLKGSVSPSENIVDLYVAMGGPNARVEGGKVEKLISKSPTTVTVTTNQ